MFLQSFYGEPSIQQKILGLLVGSEFWVLWKLLGTVQRYSRV